MIPTVYNFLFIISKFAFNNSVKFDDDTYCSLQQMIEPSELLEPQHCKNPPPSELRHTTSEQICF